MRTVTAVIERDRETGLYVGYVPGWPGAHSQGATLDELRENLREVIGMLSEDGERDTELPSGDSTVVALTLRNTRTLSVTFDVGLSSLSSPQLRSRDTKTCGGEVVGLEPRQPDCSPNPPVVLWT